MDHTILVIFSRACLHTHAVTGKAIARHTSSIFIQAIDMAELSSDL
jgi:hypothetical protein